MYTFVIIKYTRIKSLCKPLEIKFNNNFFLCKLLRAVTPFFNLPLFIFHFIKYYYRFLVIIFESSSAKRAMFFRQNRDGQSQKS